MSARISSEALGILYVEESYPLYIVNFIENLPGGLIALGVFVCSLAGSPDDLGYIEEQIEELEERKIDFKFIKIIPLAELLDSVRIAKEVEDLIDRYLPPG